ncbi:MAG: cytochrome c peroxidase, partial [Desulfuromonadaceae bacterium]
ILATVALFSMVMAAGSVSGAALIPIEQLGKLIYFNPDLSKYQNQSCASCHDPDYGFVDPTNSEDPYYTVVSTGSDGTSTGGRNSPTAAYAGFSPVLHVNAAGEYVGGMFWDGR